MSSLRQKLAASSSATKPSQELRTQGARLELEREPESFNPYTRTPTERAASSKRDLRKLSEWIKMMRAVEERKQRGE